MVSTAATSASLRIIFTGWFSARSFLIEAILDVLAARCGRQQHSWRAWPVAGEDAIISQIKAAKASEGRPRRIKRSWALVFATVAWLTVAVLARLSRRRL